MLELSGDAMLNPDVLSADAWARPCGELYAGMSTGARAMEALQQAMAHCGFKVKCACVCLTEKALWKRELLHHVINHCGCREAAVFE